MQPAQKDASQPKFFRLNDVAQKPVVSSKLSPGSSNGSATSDHGHTSASNRLQGSPHTRTTPVKIERASRSFLSEPANLAVNSGLGPGPGSGPSSALNLNHTASVPYGSSVHRASGATSPTGRAQSKARGMNSLRPELEPSISSPALLASPNLTQTSPTSSVKYKVSSTSPLGKSQRQIKDLEISNKSLLTVNRFLEKRIRRQQDEIESLKESEGHSISTPTEMQDMIGYSEDLKEIEEEDKEYPEVQKETMDHLERLKANEDTNRILHKCIYITERLLKDAQSAMDYNVNPESIRIGGKVLFRDDSDEEKEDDNENEYDKENHESEALQ